MNSIHSFKFQTFHLWIAEITTNPHWSIIWTKINFNTQHKVTNKDKRWLDSSLTDNFLTGTKKQIRFYNHFEGKKTNRFLDILQAFCALLQLASCSRRFHQQEKIGFQKESQIRNCFTWSQKQNFKYFIFLSDPGPLSMIHSITYWQPCCYLNDMVLADWDT